MLDDPGVYVSTLGGVTSPFSPHFRCSALKKNPRHLGIGSIQANKTIQLRIYQGACQTQDFGVENPRFFVEKKMSKIQLGGFEPTHPEKYANTVKMGENLPQFSG